MLNALHVPSLCLLSCQGHRVGVFKDDMYVELRVLGMPHDTATQSSPHKNNTGRLVVDKDFSFQVKPQHFLFALLMVPSLVPQETLVPLWVAQLS